MLKKIKYFYGSGRKNNKIIDCDWRNKNMKKAAVVTGASSGIGLAISRMLVKTDMKFLELREIFQKYIKKNNLT